MYSPLDPYIYLHSCVNIPVYTVVMRKILVKYPKYPEALVGLLSLTLLIFSIYIPYINIYVCV